MFCYLNYNNPSKPKIIVQTQDPSMEPCVKFETFDLSEEHENKEKCLAYYSRVSVVCEEGTYSLKVREEETITITE